jgi:hypothetical protein
MARPKNPRHAKPEPLPDLGVLQGETLLLWTAVAAVFGLGALFGWRQIASPDIGFHLSTARWMVEHRAWPTTDLFSFTFVGHPYVDLQWLFQLLLYGANALGGTSLIITLKIAVTLLFWGLLVVRARRAAGALPWFTPLVLLLVALGDYYEERPHLFSWVYGSLVLLVLEEYGRGNRRWLPALPAILLLWVNTHQLFVLGLVLIGVHAAWELRKGAGADRALFVWGALSAAACLINPYGVKALLFPLTLLGEIQSSHVFAGASTGIAELQPPFSLSLYYLAGRFVLFQPPLYWHLYTALIVVGLVGAWRKARVPDLVVWAGFAYVFARAHKNLGYFVMATFPLAVAGLDLAMWRIRTALARRRAARAAPVPAPRAVLWAPLVLAVALVPLTLSGRLYKLAWSDFPIRSGYNSTFLPVEASQFLVDHRIEGKILTTFGYGSYVHWITRQPVSIYGIEEVFGPEFYAEYIASLGPDGLQAFLNKWQPTIAIVSITETPYWLFYLNGEPDWRLVQFNQNAAVFLRASVPGPPALGAPRPGVDFPEHSREEMTRIVREAADRPDMTLRAWFQGNAALEQPAIRLSTLYLYTGRFDACVNTGVEALARSPIRIRELLLIVGTAWNALGDYQLADLAFGGVLKSPDTDAQTRQQIQAQVAARTGR